MTFFTEQMSTQVFTEVKISYTYLCDFHCLSLLFLSYIFMMLESHSGQAI